MITAPGYFNLSKWKALISPNFHKIFRILRAPICPNFKMREAPIPPNFRLICSKCSLKEKLTSFPDEKVVKNPYTSFLGCTR